MALVTFQVLDGLERGEVYANLPTPVTIGREDDNHIRLNDERVSRFHAKVQEDNGHVILTDLTSTNGTRVNGHPVQVHVLQVGDQVLIGRCLLLYGSPEQLEERVRLVTPTSRRGGASPEMTVAGGPPVRPDEDIDLDSTDTEIPAEMFPAGPPSPPKDLTPLQVAQVSDMLAYAHSHLLRVLLLAREQADEDQTTDGWMTVPAEAWIRLQQLEVHLGQCLRRITDP